MSAQDPYAIRRATPGDPGTADPTGPTGPAVATGPVRWRVRPVLPVVKGVGAVLFLAAGLWSLPDRPGVVIGVAAAAVLAALALRDVVAGVRLAADRSGVTVVTGYAGHRTLRWDEIERVRLDSRSRLGVRTELLEIDAGETIHLFGRNELGAPCDDVLATLRTLRDAPAT